MQILFNNDNPPDGWPDPAMAELVARYAEFTTDESGSVTGELIVVVVGPGDTLSTIDAACQGQFMADTWSGKNIGDEGFVPAFETLHDHGTFYEVSFIQGDGFSCTLVLVLKQHDIDAEILSICRAHAKTAPELAP